MVKRLGAALCGAATIFAFSNLVMAHCGITPVYAYADGKTAPVVTRLHAMAAVHRPAIDANGHVADRKKGAFVVKFEPYDCSELRFQMTAYHSVLAPFVDFWPQRVTWSKTPKGASVVGMASMYNPFEHDPTAGGLETASGELYDPAAWTAAIQTGLRANFGGLRYGSEYHATYALVEAGDKHVIVKINDVGPLRPGRVIDFSEQTMRFFDPTLQQGLVKSVKITPLVGDRWRPGPVGG